MIGAYMPHVYTWKDEAGLASIGGGEVASLAVSSGEVDWKVD